VWWELSYDAFLGERRRRMADVVRAAWERLRGGPQVATAALTTADLIAGGETEGVEFKSTLRTNLHTGHPNDKVQMAALKTIAAFLNASGGTLLIGVADDGVVTGLGPDGFPTEDKMSLHLVNLIRYRIGELFLPDVHPEFLDHDGVRVPSVRCEPGPKPAFVKEGLAQRFFVRGANATAELIGQAVIDYTGQRFK
jgi:predicted HTH transcriptional regulator